MGKNIVARVHTTDPWGRRSVCYSIHSSNPSAERGCYPTVKTKKYGPLSRTIDETQTDEPFHWRSRSENMHLGRNFFLSGISSRKDRVAMRGIIRHRTDGRKKREIALNRPPSGMRRVDCLLLRILNGNPDSHSGKWFQRARKN
ncbi:hypothetical protein B0H14DRAFT_2593170 [Mycena olivaceomarginata]|nr:hypothetical protein B0H14DRAFT_2593170 [Mycena olivaceomarginata]